MEVFSMTGLDIGWVTPSEKSTICVIYILPKIVKKVFAEEIEKNHAAPTLILKTKLPQRISTTSPGSSGTTTPFSRIFGSSAALSPCRVSRICFGSCRPM